MCALKWPVCENFCPHIVHRWPPGGFLPPPLLCFEIPLAFSTFGTAGAGLGFAAIIVIVGAPGDTLCVSDNRESEDEAGSALTRAAVDGGNGTTMGCGTTLIGSDADGAETPIFPGPFAVPLSLPFAPVFPFMSGESSGNSGCVPSGWRPWEFVGEAGLTMIPLGPLPAVGFALKFG